MDNIQFAENVKTYIYMDVDIEYSANTLTLNHDNWYILCLVCLPEDIHD
jgi:hypothetical protein